MKFLEYSQKFIQYGDNITIMIIPEASDAETTSHAGYSLINLVNVS